MELDFEQWLKTKLKLLDIDEEVLGHRIYQVLVKEDSLEDKNTCLENLLASFIGSQTKEHTTEIVERWNLHKNQKGNLVVSNDDTWEEPVCELLKKNLAMQPEVEPNKSEDELRIRNYIINKYGFSSVSSEKTKVKLSKEEVLSNQNYLKSLKELREDRKKMKVENELKKKKKKNNQRKEKRKSGGKRK